jgi:hypothetical protein
MKLLSRRLILFILPILIGISFAAIVPSQRTEALTGGQFNASRIIDDFVFSNSGAMTADDVQRFLNAKVPTCDTWGTQMRGSQTRAAYGASVGNPAPYTCLKNYQQTTPAMPAENGLCNYYPGGTKSAAQIIKEVGVACGLNPQVMLVLLQKEQSLITDDWPWQNQYNKATGFGCPDTAPCDPSYGGYFYQVYYAARQFKKYARDSHQYGYKAGRNNYVQYNPVASCGGSTIYIQNQATANLYIYTPYQPNQAALNNLYGTGDSCSAYGNRNFWRMFMDWFGTTYANDTNIAHPDGTLVTDNHRIYRVEDGTRRHIVTPNIFTSYGYNWGRVKQASTGDNILPLGPPLNSLANGSIFSFNSAVYIAFEDNGTMKKQWLSLSAFNALGYKWSQVIPANTPGEIPNETVPGFYISNRHPNGTLINQDGRVYVILNNQRRYVSAFAFDTNHLKWSKLYSATAEDKNLPEGLPLDIGEGTILYSGGNIYAVQHDQTGALKRPIAPWECYADRLRYSWTEWYSVPAHGLPSRTGANFMC